MLKVFETAAELQEAEQLTSNSVYLLPIHYSIRHERHGVYPEAKCKVFGYPDQSPFLWMVIRRNKFTRLLFALIFS
ncbi:unnamed protein product [Gongylonema pulchrum]|uniref:Myotubularin phosphatase domain-containing protein n=1 Tax=Gongylonema pulchrum TaxID=637853 RepID=A0A183DKG7_9BILA|nr:unnamed protein product [Gongylonema pulchrum]